MKYYCYLVVLIGFYYSHSALILDTNTTTPKYCIDNNVLEIFKERYSNCMIDGSAIKELQFLRTESASDFQRAHELIAHKYFVEDENPHRVSDCREADFEYIPLLPLSWRTGIPTNTLCTANGYCPPKNIQPPNPKCTYKALIQDIAKYVEYVTDKKGLEMSAGIPKFSVASTFNLRTSIGFGLPNSNRGGPLYNAVTSYVINSYIGHYERHPQCPDVLRKWWKHVGEIPYNPIQTRVLNGQISNNDIKDYERSYSFFFSGRLLLWGPERVCSVRCSVAYLADRKDALIINITDDQTYQGVSDEIVDYMYKSVFCIVTKADSYSTAFFYDSIQAGCIPIVVSNWFIFSFPWYIPYAKFVLRINEDDFVKDPHGCLDEIKSSMDEKTIKEYQTQMKHWKKYLTYETNEIEINPSGTKIKSILPFELLLREFKTVQTTEVCPKCIYTFCHRSTLCEPLVPFFDFKDKLKETRSHLCQHASRIIGHYKMVYFMSCVRILWPLKLGQFKPIDLKPGSLTETDVDFVMKFHNVTTKNEKGVIISGARPEGWTYVTYPPLNESIANKIKNFESKLPK